MLASYSLVVSAELLTFGGSPLTLPADLTSEEIYPVKPIDSSHTSVSSSSLDITELVAQPSDQSPVSSELVERSICEQLIVTGLDVS